MWLSELPDFLQEIAKERMRSTRGAPIGEDLNVHITWDATPEGNTFWKILHRASTFNEALNEIIINDLGHFIKLKKVITLTNFSENPPTEKGEYFCITKYGDKVCLNWNGNKKSQWKDINYYITEKTINND